MIDLVNELSGKMSVITSASTSSSVTTSGSSKTAKMYNLNVNCNSAPGNNIVSNLLAVESACTTPRTPEILNSLIAMSNPLDDYNYNASEKCATGGPRSRSGNDSNSNSSGSPLGSPASSSTPSIRKTCSQLIKAGLKLSIESKRKMSGSDAGDAPISSKRLKKEEASDDDYDDVYLGRRGDGLTPEDEERRRRRRERNKIAATKCRLKKRERTVNLVSESETLETQNIDLKSQIQELEVQRRQLVDMLSQHTPSCMKNNNNTSSPTTPYNPIQPPYDSPTNYPGSTTPYEPNSPYIRPESANILASSYNNCCDVENPPSNYNQPVDTLDIGTPYSSIGTPTSEGNYMRQDDTGYVTSDNYTKGNLLVENSESVYIEIPQFENPEINPYHYNHTPSVSSAQQCHNVNSGETRRRNKFRNTGIDNGCMA